jgi:hypothetical protein
MKIWLDLIMIKDAPNLMILINIFHFPFKKVKKALHSAMGAFCVVDSEV